MNHRDRHAQYETTHIHTVRKNLWLHILCSFMSKNVIYCGFAVNTFVFIEKANNLIHYITTKKLMIYVIEGMISGHN